MTNHKFSLLSGLALSLSITACASSEDETAAFKVRAIGAIAISQTVISMNEPGFAADAAGYAMQVVDGATILGTSETCTYDDAATPPTTTCTFATPVAGALANGVTIEAGYIIDDAANDFGQFYVATSTSLSPWTALTPTGNATLQLVAADCDDAEAAWDSFVADMDVLAAQLATYDTRTNKTPSVVAQFNASLAAAADNIAAAGACPDLTIDPALEPAALTALYSWL